MHHDTLTDVSNFLAAAQFPTRVAKQHPTTSDWVSNVYCAGLLQLTDIHLYIRIATGHI